MKTFLIVLAAMVALTLFVGVVRLSQPVHQDTFVDVPAAR